MQQGAQQRVPMLPGDLKAVANGSAEQIELAMHDYEYSSIMDYHGTVNGDFQGIGRYDEAAILFAYSGGTKPGYVEVFEGARASSRSFPASDGTTLTLRGAAVDLPAGEHAARAPRRAELHRALPLQHRAPALR